MAARAVVGRGLRETGAALKHASGIEVRMDCICVIFEKWCCVLREASKCADIFFDVHEIIFIDAALI